MVMYPEYMLKFRDEMLYPGRLVINASAGAADTKQANDSKAKQNKTPTVAFPPITK